MAFTQGHLLSAAINYKDNTDVGKLFKGKVTSGDSGPARDASKEAADSALFGIIISMIDNDDLVTHLATTYPEKGMAALDYIKQSFDNGDESDRLTNANNAYLKVQTKVLDQFTLTPEEFVANCNEMDMARIELKGTFRAISDGHHAANLIDMICGIPGGYYRSEVRHLMSALDKCGDPWPPS